MITCVKVDKIKKLSSSTLENCTTVAQRVHAALSSLPLIWQYNTNFCMVLCVEPIIPTLVVVTTSPRGEVECNFRREFRWNQRFPSRGAVAWNECPRTKHIRTVSLEVGPLSEVYKQRPVLTNRCLLINRRANASYCPNTGAAQPKRVK